MSDFVVTDKTLLTSVDRSADSFLIYDASASALKRTTVNYGLDLTSHPVGIDDTQTLTAKTITAPTISSPVLSGTVTGTYTIGGTPTFPSAVATLTGSQTLTNKTLTSPTINTATISNPTLTTDTVSEHTAANGVTVDGLNIKDSKLNTNDSVVTANITNLAVTTAKINDDAVTAAKMINGQIYRRRGGSATVWGTGGTTDYDVSASDVKIQAGTTANSASPTTHTFPVAFTYAPVVVANVVTAIGANTFAVVSAVITTGFTCQVVTDAGAANTTQTINWVAIGI